MRKKVKRNLKNKAMAQIIVKRMMTDRKNKHRKKITKKTKMKKIQLLKINN